MTGWRPQWAAVCAVCRRQVARRLTVWSVALQRRVCRSCIDAHPDPDAVLAHLGAPAAVTRVRPPRRPHRPDWFTRDLVPGVTTDSMASQHRDSRNQHPHNQPMTRGKS